MLLPFLTLHLAACGTDKRVFELAPTESVTQISFSRHLNETWPAVWLVIVDDRPDALAQELRDSILQGSEHLYDQYDSADCGIHPDPAYFRAIDYSLIVVGASRPEDALHPGRLADLRANSENASHEVQQTWHAAFAEAMGAIVRDIEHPQRYIDALYYWSELLAGAREPRYESEVALLDNLPPAFEFVPVLGMSARDSSTSVVEPWDEFWRRSLDSADWPLRERAGWADVRVQVSGGAPPSCWRISAEDAGEPLSTLLGSYAYVSLGSCEFSRGPLSPNFVADCAGYPCMATPDAIEGQSACKISVTVDASATCDRAGWQDPVGAKGNREPHYEETSEGHKRVCEVKQLSGAALTACKTDPYCEGCEAGWCLRNYWEEVEGDAWYDWKNSYCAPDQTSQGLIRFTLGTDQGEGKISVQCESGR